MSAADQKGGYDLDGKPMKCDEIQAVLFDYMTRELGEARSDLVREHLRRCPACQKDAADIGATLEALQGASPHGEIDEHLSHDRRKRLMRAYMHPLLDWVYSHHVLISIVVALIVLGVVLGMLVRKKVWSFGPPEPGHTVTIGKGAPPQTDTNVPPNGPEHTKPDPADLLQR